jgi:DNA invertase Pin-like site-specific DNA recombinase
MQTNSRLAILVKRRWWAQVDSITTLIHPCRNSSRPPMPLTIQEIDEPAGSLFVPPYHPRRLTPDEVKGVIERYVSGESAAQLARDLGVHKHTMQAIRAKAGVKRPFCILDRNQIDEVVDLYGQGKSAATIGRELGINPATVRFALRKRGVKLRGPNDWRSLK